MTTPVAPKPTPKPRPASRTMGQSIVGHGTLIGGSVIPWAGATFGVGGLLAGAGVTAAGAIGAAGVRKAARKARGRRASGSLTRGGVGAGRGIAGRSRAGGSLLGSRSGGIGGGRASAGKRGGLGSKSRGFLGKLAGGRSGSPKRGGGIPGAGTTPTSKRNPLSKGRTAGSRMPGLGKRSTGLSGSKTGSKRGGGLKLPGSSRSGRGVPGGRTRAGSKGGGLGGSIRKGLSSGKRSGTGSGSSAGSGRSKGLRLTKGGKTGKGILGDSRVGKAIRSKPLSIASLKRRAKNARTARVAVKKKTTQPSGWKEVPLKTPSTKKQRKEQGVNMERMARQDEIDASRQSGDGQGSRPRSGAGFVPVRGGSTGRSGGNVTAAAEQLATAMAKPGTDINPIKRLDGFLGDLSGGVGVAAKGLKDAAAQVTEAQPDNPQLAEQIGQAARLIQQASQVIEQAKANNKRKLAGDFDRIEAPRKNEAGRFDYRSNQD